MSKCFLVQNIGDTPGKYALISDELANAIESFEKRHSYLHSQYSGVQLFEYMNNFPGGGYQKKTLKEILTDNAFEKLLDYCIKNNFNGATAELTGL